MINPDRTGVYIAFPTTAVLKPIYRGYKAQVNNIHTKVGIARTSFRVRERQYRLTFGGEIEFRPIVEVPAQDLLELETRLLAEIRASFRRVGRSREWFDTVDRDSMAQLIVRLASS